MGRHQDAEGFGMAAQFIHGDVETWKISMFIFCDTPEMRRCNTLWIWGRRAGWGEGRAAGLLVNWPDISRVSLQSAQQLSSVRRVMAVLNIWIGRSLKSILRGAACTCPQIWFHFGHSNAVLPLLALRSLAF